MATSGTTFKCSHCDALKADLAALRAEVDRLTNELAKARKNSATSSKRPSSDIVKPPRKTAKAGQKKKPQRGGQPGHQRHQRPPFDASQISVVENYSLADCPHCGGTVELTKEPPRVVQQVEIQDTPIVITEHRGQAIVRCLVERVVVEVERNSEDAVATIHWIGGFESRHEFARPVRTYDQLSEADLLMKRIAELREAGKTAEQTADALNAEGYAPINPGRKFNRDIVRKLLLKLGLCGERDNDSLLGPGEWWVHDLADEVGMPWQTLRAWAVNGWVHARQTNVEKLWIMWADRAEIKRLRKLRRANWRGILGKPSELTTPKPRPAEKR